MTLVAVRGAETSVLVRVDSVGHVRTKVPSPAGSAPRIADDKLSARELRFVGAPLAFDLRVDETGRILASPEGTLPGSYQLDGDDLLVNGARYSIDATGRISPSLGTGDYELRLRSAGQLTPAQRWLLVLGELANLRGTVASFIVWGMGEAYGCEADPERCRPR